MQNELRPGNAVVESVASSVDYTGSGRSVSDIAYLLSFSLCAICISQFRCLSDRCLFLCRFIIWQKLGNVI